MKKNAVTLESLAELINGIKTDINRIESKMDKLESETRARHYDMQNLTYSNNNLSTSAYVSTAASVGRSPRRLVNSYDTYRWWFWKNRCFI